MIKLKIDVGKTYSVGDEEVQVQEIIGLNEVLIEYTKTKEKKVIRIGDLSSPSSIEIKTKHIESYTEKEWKEAKRRLKIIKPLLNKKNTETEVSNRAEKYNVHRSTVYRWLSDYEESESLVSLIPTRRGRKKGVIIIEEDVEAIIQDKIQNVYLTRERITIPELVLEIHTICHRLGFDKPHPNTIRNRVKSLNKEFVYSRRRGKREAKLKFGAVEKEYDHAKYPLAIVQIDHTPLDIILVDEIKREPIGKPNITLVIDVFSRVVLGFYLSFDPVSSTSVGLAIAHSISRKEEYLDRLGVEGRWDISGLFNTVHVDNAKEFRSNAFIKACEKYGISIEWRPVGRPDYGGHVESAIGTLNEKIKNLPGSTFSNVVERANYKAEKEACLTLEELEKWIIEFIINIYHNKEHSTIEMSPLQKLEEGIFGTPTTAGRGIPDQVQDLDTLKIDYMPTFERTIQRYGVSIDNVHYYSDVLRKWVYSEEKKNTKRKFIFKRDPRDISKVYFYDPELEEYFEVHYRNTARPAISVWELNEARRKLSEQKQPIDEDTIFSAHERMQEIKHTALKEKRKAARGKKKEPSIDKSSNHIKNTNNFVDNLDDDIEPFQDISEW